MPAKLFALSFIGIILIGNVWAGQAAFGGIVSEWVPVSFRYLMMLAFVFGIAMIASKIFLWLTKPPEAQL